MDEAPCALANLSYTTRSASCQRFKQWTPPTFARYIPKMYVPPDFKGNIDQAKDMIRHHPFASLISLDDAGQPSVTHLPLHMEERPSATLRADGLGQTAQGSRISCSWPRGQT